MADLIQIIQLMSQLCLVTNKKRSQGLIAHLSWKEERGRFLRLSACLILALSSLCLTGPQALSASSSLSVPHWASLWLSVPHWASFWLFWISVPHWASTTLCLIGPSDSLGPMSSFCLFWVSLCLIGLKHSLLHQPSLWKEDAHQWPNWPH